MRALGLCALNHGSNADTAEQQRMELVVARLQGAREPAVCHRRTRADGRQYARPTRGGRTARARRERKLCARVV